MPRFGWAGKSVAGGPARFQRSGCVRSCAAPRCGPPQELYITPIPGRRARTQPESPITRATVTLWARHDKQREIATRFGATIGDPARAPEDRALYDLVVEAAGSCSALDQAALSCKPGGTLLVLGTYWNGLHMENSLILAQREVRLVFAVMYSRDGVVRDFDLAASLLARQNSIAEDLITHRFPLDAAPAAFEIAADRQSGAVKVVLEP